jgi:hypothetical protein
MKAITALQLIFAISAYCASKPTVELEGCFSLNSFSNNVRISAIEKASLVFRENVVANFFGEQSYRNYSFINSIFTGVEYRFLRKNVQLPIGLFCGLNDIHIGQYSSILPVVGANTGFILPFNEIVSLRVNYYGKCYYAEQNVFGNDIYIGIGIKINKTNFKENRSN